MTTTWTIRKLDVAPSKDGLTNIVTQIHWRVTATDGTVSENIDGGSMVDVPDPELFTDFTELTEAIVLGWLSEIIDFQALEVLAEKLLLDKLNPPIISPPLPWVQ